MIKYDKMIFVLLFIITAFRYKYHTARDTFINYKNFIKNILLNVISTFVLSVLFTKQTK